MRKRRQSLDIILPAAEKNIDEKLPQIVKPNRNSKFKILMDFNIEMQLEELKMRHDQLSRIRHSKRVSHASSILKND